MEVTSPVSVRNRTADYGEIMRKKSIRVVLAILLSKEFADYIESFGSNTVPVKFHVHYDGKNQVVGAMLEGVGEWPEERFSVNEGLLGTGFRMSRGQRTVGGHFDNPADCFPKRVK